MTTLAIGSSITIAVRDGGTITISTNGGFGSAVVTLTEGQTSTVSFGPAAERRVLGPYKEGASVVLTNSSSGAFDYDAETQFDPSNVNIGGGSINRTKILRPTQFHGSIEFGIPTAGNQTGTTYENRRSVPLSFVGGAVIAYSAGAAPAANGVQCAVGTATDTVTQASNFSTVTWGNGKTSPSGANLFAGTPNAGIIEMAVSDPFVLAPVARTDGGSGYIVALRTVVGGLFAYSTSVGGSGGAAGQQFNTAGGSDVYFTLQATGDFVTTNQAGFGTPAPLANGNNNICDLILFSDSTIYTVGAGGDSITQGQYTASGRDNEIRLACNWITAQGIANVSYLNRAAPGSTSSQFGPNSIEFVKKVKPSIFFYTPLTPNDGSQTASLTANQVKAFMYALKRACDDAGTLLVVCTPAPWTPFGVSDDNVYKSFISLLTNFAANAGIGFYDRYSLLTNGQSPAAIPSPYHFVDADPNKAAHPSLAGYQLCQPTVQTLIRSLIGK